MKVSHIHTLNALVMYYIANGGRDGAWRNLPEGLEPEDPERESVNELLTYFSISDFSISSV